MGESSGNSSYNTGMKIIKLTTPDYPITVNASDIVKRRRRSRG